MTERLEQLRIVARGRCTAAMRSFGGRVKWLPAVDGMIAALSEDEVDCLATSKEAVAAAKRFRDEARAKLHEEFGES
jgi:hypothetical protein